MKKCFTFILTAIVLSVGMVGCGKEDLGPETEQEDVEVSLVGKWQKDGWELAGYQDGEFVTITEPEILEHFQAGIMPDFAEVTLDKFIMFMDPGSMDDPEERAELTYTLEAETNTIVLSAGPIEDGDEPHVTYAKYDLSEDKNTMSLIIVQEGDTDGDDEIDLRLRLTMKFKRIANWPAG